MWYENEQEFIEVGDILCRAGKTSEMKIRLLLFYIVGSLIKREYVPF